MSRNLILAACACCLAVACDDDDHDDEWTYVPSGPPAPVGTLEYRWSIDGRRVAEDCDDVGAVLFESLVVDQGFLIDRLSAPCDDFEASLPLYDDDFVARSALTDASGLLAVGRISEDVFAIEEGKVTRLTIDFPSGAPVPMEPGELEPDAGAPSVPDAAAPEPQMPEPQTPEPADAGADAGSP